jgi:hypothetical protein
LERTECEGYWQVYAVTIYRDGKVIFVGEKFVRHQGELAFHVTSRTLQEVTSAFDTAGFQTFREAYNKEDATDLPWVYVSFNDGNAVKRVAHHLGDASAPRALTLLEERIDSIIGTEKLIGTEIATLH